MFDVPLNELLLLAVAIGGGGVVAGVLAGLFGVGGGMIVVPVLYEVFRLLKVPDAVHMQLCIGTSLAIMVPTNIRSYRAHLATGAVLTDVVRRWTPGVLVGIAIGSGIATVAPSPVFKIAFVVIAVEAVEEVLVGKLCGLGDHGEQILHGPPVVCSQVCRGIPSDSLRFLVESSRNPRLDRARVLPLGEFPQP